MKVVIVSFSKTKIYTLNLLFKN